MSIFVKYGQYGAGYRSESIFATVVFPETPHRHDQGIGRDDVTVDELESLVNSACEAGKLNDQQATLIKQEYQGEEELEH